MLCFSCKGFSATYDTYQKLNKYAYVMPIPRTQEVNYWTLKYVLFYNQAFFLIHEGQTATHNFYEISRELYYICGIMTSNNKTSMLILNIVHGSKNSFALE